jgi:hypothetical protein
MLPLSGGCVQGYKHDTRHLRVWDFGLSEGAAGCMVCVMKQGLVRRCKFVASLVHTPPPAQLPASLNDWTLLLLLS